MVYGSDKHHERRHRSLVVLKYEYYAFGGSDVLPARSHFAIPPVRILSRFKLIDQDEMGFTASFLVDVVISRTQRWSLHWDNTARHSTPSIGTPVVASLTPTGESGSDELCMLRGRSKIGHRAGLG